MSKEPPITVWTWEDYWRTDTLHLVPPDPWDVEIWLCGKHRDPGIWGYEIEGEPDLANWPKRGRLHGCLSCKAVYAARLGVHH